MFHKIALAALVLTLSPSAFASEHSLINLKSSKASQTIRIDYPGVLSGVCGLEIKTSSDNWISSEQKAAIASKIQILDGLIEYLAQPLEASVSERGPSWELETQGTYVTKIQVRTLGGESLDKAVKSVLGHTEGAVLLTTTGCPSHNPN